MALYIGSAGFNKLIRLDNINSTTNTPLVLDTDHIPGSICAISIDRTNNWVYYATRFNDGFYRRDYDGNNLTPLSMDGMTSINGLSVNQTTGNLYILCTYSGSQRIVEYNPTSQSVTSFSNPDNISSPWDILLKPPYIYISNNGGSNGYKIMQFNLDLQMTGSFGEYSFAYPDPATGHFYGPKNFISIREDDIILIDESDQPLERIVSFSNISGSDWEIYGSSGSGTGAFYFYSPC